MTQNPATIGDIMRNVPLEVRRKWNVEKPYSYTPTMKEIREIFPQYRDKYGKPSTVFDGISVDGEHGDEEYVDKADVHFKRTVIDHIECSVSTGGAELPISGGSFDVSCAGTFVWETDGEETKTEDFIVTPMIECGTGVCSANSVTINPNISTKEIRHKVVCKYGYKGKMCSETIIVTQKANGYNEWEIEKETDRSLIAECGQNDFTKSGGMTWYKVTLVSSEVWVRRDYLGNVIEREVRKKEDEDVTEMARVMNQYTKRFSVADGEIVCLPQRPNNTAVAFHVKFVYEKLETTLRLTQECGDRTTDEAIFAFKNESGDTASLTDKDGTLETEIPIDSKIVERIGDEVVSSKPNRNIRIIGKPEWIDARITDDGENIALYIRTLSPNADKTKPRTANMVLTNRESFTKPLKVNVCQPPCSQEGTRVTASVRYPREVLMELCEGDTITIDVYEIKTYSDGSMEKRVADPSKYDVVIAHTEDGSMISASKPSYDNEFGHYESTLSFISENMNDYFDFHVEVIDKGTGETAYTGKVESIHCKEIPVREVRPDKIECVHLIDTRRNKVSDLKKNRKFVLKRDEHGKLTIGKK